jgi:hypothetical protein
VPKTHPCESSRPTIAMPRMDATIFMRANAIRRCSVGDAGCLQTQTTGDAMMAELAVCWFSHAAPPLPPPCLPPPPAHHHPLCIADLWGPPLTCRGKGLRKWTGHQSPPVAHLPGPHPLPLAPHFLPQAPHSHARTLAAFHCFIEVLIKYAVFLISAWPA